MRAMLLAIATVPMLAQSPYFEAKEQALADALRRVWTPVDHPAAVDYTRRIGARLDSGCKFDIVREGTEPVSLPGCTILIPAKFFAVAADEAEFAGVLAHAVAHARLGHGFRPARNQAQIPIVFPEGCHVLCGDPASLVPLALAGQQRSDELQADRLGVEIAMRAGWPGAAYRRYVERWQSADREYPTLPPRETRLRVVDEALRVLPAAPYSPGEEFAAVAAQLNPPVQKRVPTLRR